VDEKTWVFLNGTNGEDKTMKEATIVASVATELSPLGEIHKTYYFEWEGSKYGEAYCSKEVFNLLVLPWPVKVIKEADFGRSVVIIRKDVGWHLWWILVASWYKYFRSREYYHFKWRVIKTFEVWNLAYQPEAEILSWRNIGRKRGNV
jgi:hypothetical protein